MRMLLPGDTFGDGFSSDGSVSMEKFIVIDVTE